jgi:hypothetical protein
VFLREVKMGHYSDLYDKEKEKEELNSLYRKWEGVLYVKSYRIESVACGFTHVTPKYDIRCCGLCNANCVATVVTLENKKLGIESTTKYVPAQLLIVDSGHEFYIRKDEINDGCNCENCTCGK